MKIQVEIEVPDKLTCNHCRFDNRPWCKLFVDEKLADQIPSPECLEARRAAKEKEIDK